MRHALESGNKKSHENPPSWWRLHGFFSWDNNAPIAQAVEILFLSNKNLPLFGSELNNAVFNSSTPKVCQVFSPHWMLSVR
jgi:hypothetical protein